MEVDLWKGDISGGEGTGGKREVEEEVARESE